MATGAEHHAQKVEERRQEKLVKKLRKFKFKKLQIILIFNCL